MNSAIESSPWLAFRRANPQARLRLFCFPFAGGGASGYRIWSNELPAGVEVCPVQLPGRESRLREAAFTHAAHLAEAVAAAILPLLDKPFCFFGHSMGAVVSFELARELRRRYGLQPSQLFVSGRRPPHLPDPPIYNLPHDEFLAELQRLDGTPKEALASTELMEMMIPTLRADCQVCDTYVPAEEPPFSFPISAYGGLSDTEASRDDLQQWQQHTTGPSLVRMFPGGHFFLQSAQPMVLQTLARELHLLVQRV